MLHHRLFCSGVEIRLRRLSFIVLVCVLTSCFVSWTNNTAWANSAGAINRRAKPCAPPQKPPSIVVHVQARQPVIDHTLTREDLKRFQVATVSPYEDSNNVHVNGIMRGSISVETQSGVAWQYSGSGDDNCFWFDQIEVTLRLSPIIYIAREIPYGSCLYKEVMLHEYKHFETDFKVAKDYQIILDSELGRMTRQIGVIGPFARDAGMRPKQDLLKRLDVTVSGISERMKNDRLRRQALIDTREEYDRVAAACPDDIRKY